MALDKKTGDVIWKCAMPEADEAAYASIVVSEAAGVQAIRPVSAKGRGRRRCQDR